jgi:hypothetical protein
VIVKMIVEKQMECILAGETEVLGQKPAPAPLLSITKSHSPRCWYDMKNLGKLVDDVRSMEPPRFVYCGGFWKRCF